MIWGAYDDNTEAHASQRQINSLLWRPFLRVVGRSLDFEQGRRETVVVGHSAHEALVGHLAVQVADCAERRLDALNQAVIAEDLRFLVHHPVIGIAPAI